SVLLPLVASGASGADLVAKAQTLAKDSPDAYETNEQQFNRVGYALLAAGRAADAIVVFRANASSYAESANVFDSLAEACEKAGDVECQRPASRRVLELLAQDIHMPAGMRDALTKSAHRRLGDPNH